ncbi:hypothetical protein IR012_12520 [Pseudomonas putida]|uniref:hypothetical protein n=1 Tax=Pseudomonas putida TaxID=303 RepID=UPI0018AB99F1|nr:hypothetical protein [Pseudomonas putida]MBF8670256.1 hypothetical protein [Pseudomonas putida]MBF8713130.1 hypothetical protein [Pseudomonas putida]
MWFYSAVGRKQVLSFIGNMMSIGMILGVMVFLMATTRDKSVQYYFLVAGLLATGVMGALLNMIDLMESFADGDQELRSFKRLSQLEHGPGLGWLRSSLDIVRFCVSRRKLRIIEGLLLTAMMVVVGMAMVMVALNIANGIPR